MRIAYCNVLPALLILQVTFILVKCTQISANLNINLDFSLQKFFTQADIEIDAKLKTVELIKKYKYPVETHFVITKDGYKLCMHRMPRPGAQPVLLVHGLMSSSASWVIMGPTNGLAYILFQKGYDVWMLNTRGNIYSKEHTKKGISDRDFYDFSFHEIGTIDVPSAIDLVLEKTKFQQIQYIGHSQGSTAFFVMCSELPEYSVKVKIMQALSPTTFMEKTRSAVLKFMSFFKGALMTLLAKLGGHVISATSELIQKFQHLICPATELTSKICGTFDFVLCGFNWDTFNRTLTPIVIGHVSQGASTMQVHHYAQLHKELHFRRFDHGPTKNLIRYKSLKPPSYNLSQTQCKVVLHHGGNDWLASGSDVINLQKRLPNCIESRKVELESFTHFDFIISKDVTSLVYNRVIDLVVTN
ncbi:lipase 1-like [Drosophila miranda]|uniref:lipase 1-like n=1 Tax=Drosophila miranda TaxID=7229 RepID=UPI0007E70FA5|nr:lipase 1-like [Drosophila miranda]